MKNKKRLPKRKITVPKDCYFCKEEKNPTVSDVSSLQRFVTERGKIIPRSRSGICAKHQRRVTVAIKHARHLALISYMGQE